MPEQGEEYCDHGRGVRGCAPKLWEIDLPVAGARTGANVRFTSEVDGPCLPPSSARAGATFKSFNRASYGVRPGEDATGVKSGFRSLPTRMPE